jgi:hypothetical protein
MTPLLVIAAPQRSTGRCASLPNAADSGRLGRLRVEVVSRNLGGICFAESMNDAWIGRQSR